MLKHINFPDDLARLIDKARGEETFTSWIVNASKLALSKVEETQTQLDRIESSIKELLEASRNKPMPEPSGTVFPKSEGITRTGTKKARRRPSGEVSEAQAKIIELQRRFEEEGATGMDFLIADALNEMQIPTPTGTEWDNRRVMNTRVRLRKKGLL